MYICTHTKLNVCKNTCSLYKHTYTYNVYIYIYIYTLKHKTTLNAHPHLNIPIVKEVYKR